MSNNNPGGAEKSGISPEISDFSLFHLHMCCGSANDRRKRPSDPSPRFLIHIHHHHQQQLCLLLIVTKGLHVWVVWVWPLVACCMALFIFVFFFSLIDVIYLLFVLLFIRKVGFGFVDVDVLVYWCCLTGGTIGGIHNNHSNCLSLVVIFRRWCWQSGAATWIGSAWKILK